MTAAQQNEAASQSATKTSSDETISFIQSNRKAIHCEVKALAKKFKTSQTGEERTDEQLGYALKWVRSTLQKNEKGAIMVRIPFTHDAPVPLLIPTEKGEETQVVFFRNPEEAFRTLLHHMVSSIDARKIAGNKEYRKVTEVALGVFLHKALSIAMPGNHHTIDAKVMSEVMIEAMSKIAKKAYRPLKTHDPSPGQQTTQDNDSPTKELQQEKINKLWERKYCEQYPITLDDIRNEPHCIQIILMLHLLHNDIAGTAVTQQEVSKLLSEITNNDTLVTQAQTHKQGLEQHNWNTAISILMHILKTMYDKILAPILNYVSSSYKKEADKQQIPEQQQPPDPEFLKCLMHVCNLFITIIAQSNTQTLLKANENIAGIDALSTAQSISTEKKLPFWKSAFGNDDRIPTAAEKNSELTSLETEYEQLQKDLKLQISQLTEQKNSLTKLGHNTTKLELLKEKTKNLQERQKELRADSQKSEQQKAELEQKQYKSNSSATDHEKINQIRNLTIAINQNERRLKQLDQELKELERETQKLVTKISSLQAITPTETVMQKNQESIQEIRRQLEERKSKITQSRKELETTKFEYELSLPTTQANQFAGLLEAFSPPQCDDCDPNSLESLMLLTDQQKYITSQQHSTTTPLPLISDDHSKIKKPEKFDPKATSESAREYAKRWSEHNMCLQRIECLTHFARHTPSLIGISQATDEKGTSRIIVQDHPTSYSILIKETTTGSVTFRGSFPKPVYDLSILDVLRDYPKATRLVLKFIVKKQPEELIKAIQQALHNGWQQSTEEIGSDLRNLNINILMLLLANCTDTISTGLSDSFTQHAASEKKQPSKEPAPIGLVQSAEELSETEDYVTLPDASHENESTVLPLSESGENENVTTPSQNSRHNEADASQTEGQQTPPPQPAETDDDFDLNLTTMFSDSTTAMQIADMVFTDTTPDTSLSPEEELTEKEERKACTEKNEVSNEEAPGETEGEVAESNSNNMLISDEEPEPLPPTFEQPTDSFTTQAHRESLEDNKDTSVNENIPKTEPGHEAGDNKSKSSEEDKGIGSESDAKQQEHDGTQKKSPDLFTAGIVVKKQKEANQIYEDMARLFAGCFCAPSLYIGTHIPDNVLRLINRNNPYTGTVTFLPRTPQLTTDPVVLHINPELLNIIKDTIIHYPANLLNQIPQLGENITTLLSDPTTILNILQVLKVLLQDQSQSLIITETPNPLNRFVTIQAVSTNEQSSLASPPITITVPYDLFCIHQSLFENLTPRIPMLQSSEQAEEVADKKEVSDMKARSETEDESIQIAPLVLSDIDASGSLSCDSDYDADDDTSDSAQPSDQEPDEVTTSLSHQHEKKGDESMELTEGNKSAGAFVPSGWDTMDSFSEDEDKCANQQLIKTKKSKPELSGFHPPYAPLCTLENDPYQMPDSTLLPYQLYYNKPTSSKRAAPSFEIRRQPTYIVTLRTNRKLSKNMTEPDAGHTLLNSLSNYTLLQLDNNDGNEAILLSDLAMSCILDLLENEKNTTLSLDIAHSHAKPYIAPVTIEIFKNDQPNNEPPLISLIIPRDLYHNHQQRFLTLLLKSVRARRLFSAHEQPKYEYMDDNESDSESEYSEHYTDEGLCANSKHSAAIEALRLLQHLPAGGFDEDEDYSLPPVTATASHIIHPPATSGLPVVTSGVPITTTVSNFPVATTTSSFPIATTTVGSVATTLSLSRNITSSGIVYCTSPSLPTGTITITSVNSPISSTIPITTTTNTTFSTGTTPTPSPAPTAFPSPQPAPANDNVHDKKNREATSQSREYDTRHLRTATDNEKEEGKLPEGNTTAQGNNNNPEQQSVNNLPLTGSGVNNTEEETLHSKQDRPGSPATVTDNVNPATVTDNVNPATVTDNVNPVRTEAPTTYQDTIYKMRELCGRTVIHADQARDTQLIQLLDHYATSENNVPAITYNTEFIEHYGTLLLNFFEALGYDAPSTKDKIGKFLENIRYNQPGYDKFKQIVDELMRTLSSNNYTIDKQGIEACLARPESRAALVKQVGELTSHVLSSSHAGTDIQKVTKAFSRPEKHRQIAEVTAQILEKHNVSYGKDDYTAHMTKALPKMLPQKPQQHAKSKLVTSLLITILQILAATFLYVFYFCLNSYAQMLHYHTQLHDNVDYFKKTVHAITTTIRESDVNTILECIQVIAAQQQQQIPQTPQIPAEVGISIR